MQVFYTHVDNFVDRKNKTESMLLCFVLELWRAEHATSAWWRHCSETVFSAITSLFFVLDRKYSLFEISEFFYVCKFSIFVMVTWPIFGTLQGHFWSQTLQTSKIKAPPESAFHRYHWFGVKLFPPGCAQDSRKEPLKRKNAVFGSGSAHAKIFRIYLR